MTRSSTKRLFSLLLALLLLACPMPEAHAAEIQPRMTLIVSCMPNISVSGGRATGSASVTGVYGADSCEITLEIQEKGLIFWETVWEDSVSRSGDYASISGSVTATPGKSYRAKATVTVWSGTQSENKTFTTDWRGA